MALPQWLITYRRIQKPFRKLNTLTKDAIRLMYAGGISADMRCPFLPGTLSVHNYRIPLPEVPSVFARAITVSWYCMYTYYK